MDLGVRYDRQWGVALASVIEGSLGRVRPKLMTAGTAILGLLPLLVLPLHHVHGLINVVGCALTGSCGHGCPLDAKQSMLVTLLPDAFTGSHYGAALVDELAFPSVRNSLLYASLGSAVTPLDLMET